MSQRLAFAIWDEEKRLLQAPSCNPRPAYPLETASETSTGQRNIGRFIRSSRTPVRFILAKRRKLGKAQARCRRKSCQSRTAARCVRVRAGQCILSGGHKVFAKPLLYRRPGLWDSNLRIGGRVGPSP